MGPGQIIVGLPMQPYSSLGAAIRLPRVPMHFRRGAQRSVRIGSIVDTGASYTLAVQSVATTFGVSQAELSASPDVITFQDAGGAKHRGRAIVLTIEIGPDSQGRRLEVPDAKVYFTTASLPYDVLLGQHDFLERIIFAQANQAPRPRFSLRVP